MARPLDARVALINALLLLLLLLLLPAPALGVSATSSPTRRQSPTPSRSHSITPTHSGTPSRSTTPSPLSSTPAPTPSRSSTRSPAVTPSPTPTRTASKTATITPAAGGTAGNWLAFLAGSSFTAVMGGYTYTFSPFASVFQGTTSAGGVFNGTLLAADGTCTTGARYASQLYTGGATAAACATPGLARQSSVALSCAVAGVSVPGLVASVTESPTCFYTLAFVVNCSGAPQPGKLCVAPTPTGTPTPTQSNTAPPSPTATLSVGESPTPSRTATPTPSTTPSPSATRIPPVDWLQHGNDAARSNTNALETTLTAATVGGLALQWATVVNGATIGQPLLVTAGAASGGDIVLSGTESGYLYCIAADSGAVLWSTFLGTVVSACADLPFGLFGIGGTPVVDKAAGVVYVASNGSLHALHVSTGLELSSGGWPVTGLYDPTLLHNYGGLALINGTVYIALGGMCDNGNYVGSVASVLISSPPTVGPVFRTVPGTGGVYGGGIWGSGGVVSSGGFLFTAAGNTKGAPLEWSFYGEHGIKLHLGTLTVSSSFSVNAILDGVSDGDFGATPAVFTPSPTSGCTRTLVTLQHKAGVMFVLPAANLSDTSLGSYQLAASTGNGQFIGSSTYSAAHNLLLVVAPSDANNSVGTGAVNHPAVSHGLQAYAITPACGLTLMWQTSLGLPWDPTDLNGNAPYSSPTLAGDVVYVATGLHAGVVAVSVASGAILWRGATQAAAFATPVVASGRLLVSDWAYGPSRVYSFGVR